MEGYQNKIEAEIAELTKQIENKRHILESEKGFVEEKEIIRQAVGEKMSETSPSYVPSTSGTKTNDTVGSYLDSADENTTNVVNSLLEKVFSTSMESAMKDAMLNEPYVIDMFHDALTDKLYEKLKAEGIVK
ncbi:MAG: hypothetical protein UT05_C0003G0096 [Parcubacteria group bacterium GW2011_GWF2_38_76]|nr:MAG: hypothetical protein UT05_C0003G0096 [Parcubacteria group bacterium GW2011_GWF2_38_76]HBM46131.1 hypothetical protein [Patescibacteria group bacterium]